MTHGIISSKSLLTLPLFLEFNSSVLKFLSNTNIVNKDVDYKSHLRMCGSLTQQETLPQCPNTARYMQEDSGFCRKSLSIQSNTSQVMSESCRENLNRVGFHLAILRNPAFVAKLPTL